MAASEREQGRVATSQVARVGFTGLLFFQMLLLSLLLLLQLFTVTLLVVFVGVRFVVYRLCFTTD